MAPHKDQDKVDIASTICAKVKGTLSSHTSAEISDTEMLIFQWHDAPLTHFYMSVKRLIFQWKYACLFVDLFCSTLAGTRATFRCKHPKRKNAYSLFIDNIFPQQRSRGFSMTFLSPIKGWTKLKSVGRSILDSILHTSNGKHYFFSCF